MVPRPGRAQDHESLERAAVRSFALNEREDRRSRGSNAARAAALGAFAGAWLAASELLVAWHLPWIAGRGEEFTRGHFAFQLLAVAAFGAVSALASGLVAVAAPIRSSTPRLSVAFALAFALAAIALEARNRPGSSALAVVWITAAAVAVVALWLPDHRRAWSRMLDVELVLALALAPPWIAFEWIGVASGVAARATPIAVASAVCAAAYWRSRQPSSTDPTESDRSSAIGSRRVIVAGATCVALLGIGIARWPESAGTPPSRRGPSSPGVHVVLIVLDTVRADHTSLCGYERDTTPRLRDLARSSIVFDAAVAPGDMTLSSHASLFTGLYARSHGAHFDDRGNGRPLARQFPTLAEVLRDAGWTTSGVAANHVFFGRGFGLERGFDDFDARAPFEYELLHETSSLPWFASTRAFQRAIGAAAPARIDLRHYRTAADVLSAGRERIDSAAESGSRSFVFLNLMDAHWPCVPPPPFDTRFPGLDERFQSADWRYAMVEDVLTRGKRQVTADERAHMESQYDGAIAYMDARVGEFIDHLAQTGRLDDTLLIVTSDHGEAFGEHGLVGHAVSVYENQIHVPLLVRPPGGVAGRRVAEPVSLVDVPRTVLGALDVAEQSSFVGRDLLASVLDESPGCVAESYPNPVRGGERLRRIQRAFRAANGWKLVRGSGEARELFDLGADPGELHDAGAHSERLAALEGALDGWLRSTPEAAPPATNDGETEAARLRALGY